MLRRVMLGLARQLSDMVGDGHTVQVTFTEAPDRETNSTSSAASKSYLSISDVDDDTEQKPRRNTTQVRQETGFLVAELVPVVLMVKWQFPLHSGADDIWRWITAAFEAGSGYANFEIDIPMGTGVVRVAIQVGREGGVTIPTLSGDVREGEPNYAEVTLRVRNAKVMLPKREVPELEAIGIHDTAGTLRQTLRDEA